MHPLQAFAAHCGCQAVAESPRKRRENQSDVSAARDVIRNDKHRRSKFAEISKNVDHKYRSKLAGILDPARQTRVREIAIQAAGVRVIPWTVNEREDWLRLLDWGVDGITTDFPDRLAALFVQKGTPF